MGHDFAMQWKYFVVAFYLFSGVPVMFPNIYRSVVKLISTYVWSFSPAILLCYLLYLVSHSF